MHVLLTWIRSNCRTFYHIFRSGTCTCYLHESGVAAERFITYLAVEHARVALHVLREGPARLVELLAVLEWKTNIEVEPLRSLFLLSVFRKCGNVVYRFLLFLPVTEWGKVMFSIVRVSCQYDWKVCSDEISPESISFCVTVCSKNYSRELMPYFYLQFHVWLWLYAAKVSELRNPTNE